MSRYNTTRRQHCARCGKVTVHDVVVYIDHPVRQETVAHCTVCGE